MVANRYFSTTNVKTDVLVIRNGLKASALTNVMNNKNGLTASVLNSVKNISTLITMINALINVLMAKVTLMEKDVFHASNMFTIINALHVKVSGWNQLMENVLINVQKTNLMTDIEIDA